MATDPAAAPVRHDGVTGVRNVGNTAESEPPHNYRAEDVIDERFQLIRKVGEGGMGTVWVAHNLVLDVQVGIKLITFRGSKNRAALTRRLLDEARSAARLGHSAVIKVHDFGVTAHGDPFIAMELLGGEDLASLLERQQKLNPQTALQMLLPIAHGLAAAHDKGIVHRDIKPENIFLAHEDDGEIRPKILDFGIARMIDSPTKLTLEGTPLGTPEYMSPELARGETAEATSDVWSFSVVLYELLTGEPPFCADNYNALMQRILHSEPAVLSQHGPFDEKLDAIVMKGLQKDASERWSSMREMGRALARVLLRWGISEDICGTSLRRSWLTAAESKTTEVSFAARLPGAALEAAPGSARGSERPPAPSGAPRLARPVKARGTAASDPPPARAEDPESAPSPEPFSESAPMLESAPMSEYGGSESARPPALVPPKAATESAPSESARGADAGPLLSAATGPTHGQVEALSVSNEWSSPDTDEFQLAAIAEMNRGGDPVEVLQRAEKRRALLLVAAVVVLCFALVGSILVGTGVIGGV